MSKLNLKVVEALNALTGDVPAEYSAAIANHWNSLARERRAERAMEKAAKSATQTLRRYICRRLRLQGTEWVEFNGRGYYIDHGKKPELEIAVVDCSIFAGGGIIIHLRISPRSQAALDEAIDRLRAAMDVISLPGLIAGPKHKIKDHTIKSLTPTK